MNFLDLAWNGLAAVSMISVAVLVLAALNNYRRFNIPENLIRRMKSTPLPGMLRQLGIRPTLFLFERTRSEVENQIRNCESCTNARLCDDVLSTAQRVGNLDFCLLAAESKSFTPGRP